MKHIIKFSKKFLLFILMIVFPIQSFAAVSVSDGSAFVSKSEFSASLNNISNRMSIIENTLDAKIDSLVSSYLSRNGIWNADNQTYTNFFYKKFPEVTQSKGPYNSSFSYYWWDGEKGLSGSTSTAWGIRGTVNYNAYYELDEANRVWEVIVPNVTKTGLLNMQITIHPSTYNFAGGTQC